MNVSDLEAVVKVPITKVKPFEKNPRRIPERAVEITAESLKRFGWKQPLVVDKDYVLVVGHVRLQAAKSLGLKHVPVIVADQLTADEAAAYRIADNRTHDYTSWDYPELVDALDDLAADFSDVLGLDWYSIWTAFGPQFNVVEMNIVYARDGEACVFCGETTENRGIYDRYVDHAILSANSLTCRGIRLRPLAVTQ
jgi:hypothetical protein